MLSPYCDCVFVPFRFSSVWSGQEHNAQDGRRNMPVINAMHDASHSALLVGVNRLCRAELTLLTSDCQLGHFGTLHTNRRPIFP